MNTQKLKTLLFLVEDDRLFVDQFTEEFPEEEDFSLEIFATGEICLKNLFLDPDLVLIGYNIGNNKIKSISGIETMNKIKKLKSEVPVIILSKKDKLNIAKICFQHGAFDFVVKSETTFIKIKKMISIVLKINKLEKQLKWYMDRM